MEQTSIGSNVRYTNDGKLLTIFLDLTKPPTLSKTGKSKVTSTTNGNQSIGDGWKLGVNLYKPV